jgi:protein TonB
VISLAPEMAIPVGALLALLVLAPPPPEEPTPPAPSARTEPASCLPSDVLFPKDATGPAPERVTVRFEIADDGTARDISVGFPTGSPVSDLLLQAATRAVEICRWVPEGDPPRRVALRLPVVGPNPMGPKFTAPKMVERGCFRDAFRIPFVAVKELQVRVKFPVYPDGQIGRVVLMERFDDPEIQARLLASVEQALRSCAWIPGADTTGRPTAIYVILPLVLR